MPLHVSRYDRYPNTDRNKLATAALEACRAARASDGVSSSKFFWIDPNQIAILTDAEPGAWGIGSGREPSARGAAAMFGLADLARNTSYEVWADAKAGETTYKLAH